MKHRLTLLAASSILALAFAGCGKKSGGDAHAHAHHDHGSSHGDHKEGQGSGHGHNHTPPHGGTGVVLGNEAFHLEFVRDAAAGTLTAYVLDAHMENFVRCAATEFRVAAQANGKSETLVFQPVANAATGETAGDTSQFVTQSEWLKDTAAFDAKLVELTIRGTRYENVPFNFPKGNE